MPESKESLVWDLVERQLRNKRNEDVYDKRLTADPPPPGFDYIPRCMYFYYVRIDASGMVRVDHYFYPNGPADDPGQWRPIPYAEATDPGGIVKRLALNARPSMRVKNPPKLDSDSFENVVWTRRSYVAIFFDEGNWAFHRRIGNRPSVAFNVSEGHKPNRSFFDAADLIVDMPNRRTGGTDNRTAIVFVNHMKDGDNDGDLGGRADTYKFDMYLLAKYARSGAPAMTVIFDPGGTNQGPPLDP
jgi:hypothetical protein